MERQDPPARPSKGARQRGLSLPARVVVGALAVFGAIMLLQWVIAALLGVVKIALLIVVIVAVGAWVVSAKGSR